MRSPHKQIDVSKRKFLQKAAYIAPAILTLHAIPTVARAGSLNLQSHGGGKGHCNGKSMGDDVKTSMKEPKETLTGDFGCTDLKKKLFFR